MLRECPSAMPKNQKKNIHCIFLGISVNLHNLYSGEDKRRNFAEPETNSIAPNFGTVKSAI